MFSITLSDSNFFGFRGLGFSSTSEVFGTLIRDVIFWGSLFGVGCDLVLAASVAMPMDLRMASRLALWRFSAAVSTSFSATGPSAFLEKLASNLASISESIELEAVFGPKPSSSIILRSSLLSIPNALAFS